MTLQDYNEFKAMAAADPFWRRLALQALQEEVMPALPQPVAEPERAPGMITYQEAADLIGVRRDSIRRQVSNSFYTGGHGWIVESEFVDHIMKHAKRTIRATLVRNLELRAARAEQAAKAQRRQGAKVVRMAPVHEVDLFSQTA